MKKGAAAILRKVLASISPSPAELAAERKHARWLIARLSKYVPRGAKVRLTGSVAKGTFLRDSRETDVFLLVSRSVPRSELEGIAKKTVWRAFPKAKKEIRYAEHPYVRVYLEGRRVDVVPAYDIKNIGERQSSVDRSMLHTKYVAANLPDKRRGDVLLLKRFLKSSGLYGAEIRVEGFSGYLCELLVIKYGTFTNSLKAMTDWKVPVFIDIKGYYRKNNEDALKRFAGACLIVIDPVDRNRNVAAVVSEANLKRLASLARDFLKKPSEKFFTGSEADFLMRKKETFLRRGGRIYEVMFPKPYIVDDILWGQLKRFAKSLSTALAGADFPAAGHLIEADEEECRILFNFRERKLPKTVELEGPPLELEKNVSHFRKAHRSAKFVKRKGRIIAICKREIPDEDAALKNALSDRKIFPSHIEFLKTRFRKIK